jgi:hypothetical protein
MTRLRGLPAALSLGLCLAMVGFYAALLGNGWWTDEYLDFYLGRLEGVSFWWGRITGWSPRPVSELLLYFYSLVVAAFGRPLIVPLLGLLWLALGAALMVPVWRDRGATHRWARTAIRLGLLVLFLSGTQPTEMFYWPAGAAAYVLTLAGVVALLVPGEALPWRAAGLLLAAGTSEVGALFVLCYGGGVGLLAVARPASVVTDRRLGWLSAPVVLAIVAMALVARGRLPMTEMVVSPGSPAGHLGASVAAALAQWRLEAFGPTLPTALSHLLIYAGVAAVFAVAEPPLRRAWPWLLALAALAASAGSLVAAEYHFGTGCCERHLALRHCLDLVACAAAGMGSAPAAGRFVGGRACWASVAMTALAAIAFLPDLPKLRHDQALQGRVRTARAIAWATGHAEGDAMTLPLPPAGDIVHGPGFLPGSYAIDGGTSPVQWPMLYFGKRRMTILPP